jgi:hypothetical protein
MTITVARTATKVASHTRHLALLSAASAVVSTVITVTAGILDPGYSARSEAISALASTESRSGTLMTIGFGFLAVTAIASGLAILRALPGRLAASAAVLTVLAGVLTVGAGIFRQSCSTLQPACLDREARGDVTGSHVLHNLIALPLFVFLVVAGFLLVGAVGRSASTGVGRLPILLVATGSLGCLVWFGSGAYGSNGGLVQRALVILAYGLPVVAALTAGRRRTTR